MVSMGVGTLLVAQNLSLMEVSYAAPAPAGAPAAAGGAVTQPKKGAKRNAAASPGPGALPLPADSSNSTEFGGKGPDGAVIRAITEEELAIKAVESSGREDPFMALVPPEPGQIIPPKIDLGPINVPPIATPPPPKPVAPPATPAPVAGGQAGGTKPVPKPSIKIEDLPFAGDKAPPPQEPQWLIRGIISTGLERVCLLEGRDEQIHARVGDKLADGSVIEAISNRGVTFIRSGRRFVKLIGGTM
jgi:hypothetical protein